MKKLLVVYLLLLSYWGSFGQDNSTTFSSPYRLSWAVDVPIITTAVGAGVTYLILDSQTPVLSESYINSLNRRDVWGVDQAATYNWSMPVARVSDVFLYTSFAVPFTLLADRKVRKDYLKIGLMYAETIALTGALTSLTKNIVRRPRPFVYNENVALHYKQEKDAQYAFFSGHTSMTAAMCFMTAKIFQDYNKGSKAIPWVWAAAATFPAVTGVLRQQAGKHFWTDVVTGYLVGAAIGFLIPELHRIDLFQKKKAVKPSVSF
ncbi:phosphatase PAP2 family protein [Aureispira sp. CCB-E]|uniref:phosphatase PAP2 family protein n=1 Tax=Aureispira sp. CCB-E TaxID=3051121 RepID=UPI002868BBD9|nr:phosphatase PAP2 family protein [Aureispira sp. CCB-E]WMX16691.1 phosphatase PAP2 family protein [Aureispira sp. CCB-E]